VALGEDKAVVGGIMTTQYERVFTEEAERIAGRALGEIAFEALMRAALLGLPIEPAKTGPRSVVVHYAGRRAFFRVIGVLNPSGGFSVCLRRYTNDCGEVASVSPSGEVKIVVAGLASYLSSPGELYGGHVADVWTRRLRAAEAGMLQEVQKESLSRDVLSSLSSTLLVDFPRVKVYYSPVTLDYAAGLLEAGVLPVWVSGFGYSVSVSRLALEKLAELTGK